MQGGFSLFYRSLECYSQLNGVRGLQFQDLSKSPASAQSFMEGFPLLAGKEF